ncbi:SDR family oxidoreductase [Nonomuraea sp. KC401]|uniref:SDR family NAD(P)-dependent oxidoreductase n=1 Tax=unclassified Nonomuraea TaxID=2593643 RepID=UPI0010FD13DB|nr:MULTISPECIES: SDR family NAD(P)-dependent oxidoreductase [unclassified Nonomuraea]NBE93733.1 SDR family oxidoreductase [Nonomuraea sp. K271]TLF76996.1 SDR family oxidoreductase [Nonomuraea sp. KC401]
MDLAISGKRVLVTGGTRGLGRASALALARGGAKVVACHGRAGAAADDLARELKELGDHHHVVRADVTSEDDVDRLAGACADAYGGLDVVINNVGVAGEAPVGELTGEEWDRVMDANLTAPFLVTRATLPLLSEGGSVVYVGASAALRGRPATAHYTASKAALIGLTRSLAKELGPRGIRLNTVAPGVIDKGEGLGPPPPLRERLAGMTALGRLGTTDDVVGAVLFFASDLSRYVTGTTLNVDGGI